MLTQKALYRRGVPSAHGQKVSDSVLAFCLAIVVAIALKTIWNKVDGLFCSAGLREWTESEGFNL